MLFLMALFVLVGGMFIALALPLLHRRVPPNRIYGLRVPATFADERVWYDANARSAVDMVVLGIVIVLLTLGLPVLTNLSEEAFGLTIAAVLVVGSLGMAVRGWVLAERLLAARREEDGDSDGA
jgi:uncharacterized membrane protein